MLLRDRPSIIQEERDDIRAEDEIVVPALVGSAAHYGLTAMLLKDWTTF